ncbi:right-handed parallel beta-helix repeat-containing protein [Candidatus Eisenbacteria bacterium]|uniref:Right-handed parallel beta-helix repeat-containing protein n=1 Tax=Eiseniibacteriota bacterium TaxID=2212470 RepID=A0ABV6YLG6_UNCEI
MCSFGKDPLPQFETAGSLTIPRKPGGGLYCIDPSSPEIIDCAFIDNTTYLWGGGGAACVDSSAATFTGCTFTGNSAPQSRGGGVLCNVDTSPTFEFCTFWENSADYGGGLDCRGSPTPVSVERCTFVGNTAISGSGIASGEGGSVNIIYSIVAFGAGGEGVACLGGDLGEATLNCCDVYGNEGGDWVGCIEDQYGGIAWNIAEDPYFCDLENGDFHLAHDSPCLHPGGECSESSYGAFEGGCTRFAITSITDVPEDQGYQIRLRWNRHHCDRLDSDTTITSYSLYRRIDLRGAVRTPQEPGEVPNHLRWPPGSWEFVIEVPASTEDEYITICPTLCNLVPPDTCRSVFFARAHTEVPAIYFDCTPDSGYSIDNLAPGPPENMRFESSTVVAWDEVSEEDFDHFTVYGSEVDSLDPSAERIGYTVETNMDISAHPYAHYHVTATDFSGNEGEEASIAGGSFVPDSELPADWTLGHIQPNPFSAQTIIHYDVPQARHVMLHVFDVSGRRVCTLTDGLQQPGRHTVEWYGQSLSGERVASGVYFLQMRAGDFDARERVVILE